MAKSIEEQIEDIAKKWLSKDKNIKYYTKTESINHEIEQALKQASSKNGGKGTNFPISLFFMRKIKTYLSNK